MSITPEERALRAADIERARHSTEMEGGRSSDEARAIQDRYVNGEISAEQFRTLTLALIASRIISD